MRNAANCANCGYNKIQDYPSDGRDDPVEATEHRVYRNSNIRTITIKSGGAGTFAQMAKECGGNVSYWAPLGRTERMQETSSRVFLKPSPTYGLLPVYAVRSSGN